MVIPRKLLNVFSKTGGSYSAEGIYSENETQTTIYASVQPTTPDDLQILPEGRRQNKSYKLFTSSNLKDLQSQNPDQLEIDGERFEVIKVEKWSNNIINHYAAIVTRLEDQPIPDTNGGGYYGS